jgi:hypothetical protein
VIGSGAENWMKVWNSRTEDEFELNTEPCSRKLKWREETVKMRNH